MRKILERKLNGGNIITAINTWAISLLSYCTAFPVWAGAELELYHDIKNALIYKVKCKKNLP